MGVVKFCIGAFLLAVICREAGGVYEHNPFLSKVVPAVPALPSIVNPAPGTPDKLKQNIQQIAVVLPPGSHHQVGNPSHNHPYQPGTIVINVPPYYPQTPTYPHQPPGIHPPPPPHHPPVVPVNPQPQPTDDLHKRCLRPRGQFPSSKCNKFVNCWDTIAVEQFCPVGLAFNPAGYCDYLYNVNCHGKPFEDIPSTQPSAPPAPPTNLQPLPPQESSTAPSHHVSPAIPTPPLPPPVYAPAETGGDEKLKKKCLKPRGQFPSDICNKYVNCWDGFVVEQDCPPGLLFSYKGFCDYPYNVKCNNRVIVSSPALQPPTNLQPGSTKPTDQTTPKPPPPPLDAASYPPPTTDPKLRQKCLGPHGIFPSDYCNKFVVCWDVYAVEQDCPSGLLFSDQGYCDYAYNVKCHNRTISAVPAAPPSNDQQPQHDDTTTASPLTLPTLPTFTLPTVPTLPSLPNFTLPTVPAIPSLPTVTVPTVPSLPTFTLPSIPTLPQFTIPTPAPAADPAQDVPSYRPDENLQKKCLGPRGQFPSDYCNRYVSCWDGLVAEQDCAPGLLFSDQGYCDYAYNVNCYHRKTATPSTPSPQPGPPGNGLVVQHPLPGYEPVTLAPNPPNPPPVATDVVQPQPTYVPAPVNPALRQKCQQLRGQFPSDSCHRYIDCWDEYVVEHNCPPGLLFSEKGFCDYAYNVNCHNRTVIKTTPSSLCPSAHGTFRDKTNCSRYFTCIDNAVVANYECPSGLSYSDVIGVCDYAYRVDCAREAFTYQSPNQANLLQKVPAALLDSRLECTPGKVFRLNAECTSAALCRKTMTEVVHCPTGLAYDAPSDRCLPPQLARC